MFSIQASANTQFEFENPVLLILSCIFNFNSTFLPILLRWTFAIPLRLQMYVHKSAKFYNLMILCCSTASPRARHFCLAIFKPSNHQFRYIGFSNVILLPCRKVYFCIIELGHFPVSSVVKASGNLIAKWKFFRREREKKKRTRKWKKKGK